MTITQQYIEYLIAREAHKPGPHDSVGSSILNFVKDNYAHPLYRAAFKEQFGTPMFATYLVEAFRGLGQGGYLMDEIEALAGDYEPGYFLADAFAQLITTCTLVRLARDF